jgi:cytochrome b561
MEETRTRELVYSPAARRFHWWTVALVFIMIPLGFVMTYDGPAFKLPEAVSDRLYSIHKLLGFCVLWLVLARLVYRFHHGAPKDEPSLELWQKAAAHATHWALYALLIVVPFLGWLGVSLYGARDIFGPIALPPLASVNQPPSEQVFAWHMRGAVLIAFLVAAHIGAALFHYFIRKDGVLSRMLPGIDRRA